MISLTDYLFKSVASGGTIALNGRVASTAMVLELREKCAVNDITLRTDLRLVDQLWTEDRPALPSGMAFAYPEDYAGLSVRKKLQLVREKMEKLRLDCYVVGALDSLCWLYNLRGSDVDTSPLFTGLCHDLSGRGSPVRRPGTHSRFPGGFAGRGRRADSALR